MAISIDIETLREGAGEYDFRICTKNDTTVAEKCIEKGKIFVQSFYKAAGKLSEYDEYNDTIAEIIIDRAMFELYVKGKLFDFSEKRRIECQSKLIVQLGEVANIYKKDEIGSTAKHIGIVSKRGKSTKVNWDAYD